MMTAIVGVEEALPSASIDVRDPRTAALIGNKTT
jgi:hypothetical protein